MGSGVHGECLRHTDYSTAGFLPGQLCSSSQLRAAPNRPGCRGRLVLLAQRHIPWPNLGRQRDVE